MDGDAQPAEKAATAMTADGALSASASVWTEMSVAASTQATRGRRGRIRIAMTLPRIAPTPPAARIAAQARRRRVARPRSPARARSSRREQVPDPEEHHRRPEPRARRELLPALAQLVDEAVRTAESRGAIRIRVSRPAQTKKLTASTASATPGLPATTSAPPTAGPRTPTMFRDRPCSAFACCSRSALPSAGRARPRPGSRARAPMP